jgi:hypothetical protein
MQGLDLNPFFFREKLRSFDGFDQMSGLIPNILPPPPPPPAWLPADKNMTDYNTLRIQLN